MHVTTIVNGVDLDRLSGTIDAVTADPALARFQFRARNHWIDGGHNRTTIKGFYGAGQEDTTRTEPFTVDATSRRSCSARTGHPTPANTSSTPSRPA